MIYIAYIILLIILLRIESKQPINNKVKWIIPLLYILFIGLRGASVGVDTAAYYDHYYRFGEDGCDFVEVGFDWINRLCYHLGFSQAPFFIVCAAVAVLPVISTAYKSLGRKEYNYFVFLFCTLTFVTLCNGMRQNMACGVIFAVIYSLKDNSISKWKSFVLYALGVVVASFFHVSVLFMLPVYFIRNIKLSNKLFLIIYLASFVFVFYNISAYFPAIEIGERDYSKYIGGELTNQKASSLGFLIITLRNVILMLVMFSTKALKKYPLLSSMTLLYFVMINLGFNIPMISRINMYFVFFYILLVAILMANFRSYKSSTVRVLMPALMLVILVLTVYGIVSPTNRVLPYEFCWNNSNYSMYLDY